LAVKRMPSLIINARGYGSRRGGRDDGYVRAPNKNIENNPMQRNAGAARGAFAALSSSQATKKPHPDLIPRQNAPRRDASGVLLESSHPLQSEGAGNAGRPMRPPPHVQWG
jgi:hypothetical protein